MNILKNIFSLPGNVINYVRLVVKELQKVEWLSLKEVAVYTFAVVMITVITGLIIVGFDILFVTIRNPIFTLNL